jgi:hypothetical protein
MSQMDEKCKTCDIRTWKKKAYLDILSNNIDTLVPSLYQYIETRSIEVLGLLSQPLPHLVGHNVRFSNALERISRPCYEPLRATHTSHLNISLWISFSLSSFAHKKNHNRTLLFVSILLKHGRHVDYSNQPLNIRVHVYCVDSWSFTVLLPSDTLRNPITSFTAVLLQFVTYLVHLPRNARVTSTHCIHHAQPDTTFSIIT